MQHDRWQDGSPPGIPSANGHDLALGMALGEIRSHHQHQARALDAIREDLQDLPERIADALPKQAPPSSSPPSNPLSFRDWVWLIGAVMLAFGALSGNPAMREAGAALIRPAGGPGGGP